MDILHINEVNVEGELKPVKYSHLSVYPQNGLVVLKKYELVMV